MSAQNKLDNATQRYLHRMLFKVDITCKALASFKTYLWYVSLGQKLSELRLATIASQKCWNRGNISIHVLERSLLYELLMESWNMACLDLHDASWWHVLIWLVTHFFGLRGEGRGWRRVLGEPNEWLQRRLRYVPSDQLTNQRNIFKSSTFSSSVRV